MEKRTVYFKNGSRIKISQNYANILLKNVIDNNTLKQYQWFSKDGDLLMFINMNEVLYIK